MAGGALAAGGVSLVTANPFIIGGAMLVGGVAGGIFGEAAVRSFLENPYNKDWNGGFSPINVPDATSVRRK